MYAIRSYYATVKVDQTATTNSVVKARDMARSGESGVIVITSYSIHYTKLYEAKRNQRAPNSGAERLHPKIDRNCE